MPYPLNVFTYARVDYLVESAESGEKQGKRHMNNGLVASKAHAFNDTSDSDSFGSAKVRAKLLVSMYKPYLDSQIPTFLI